MQFPTLLSTKGGITFTTSPTLAAGILMNQLAAPTSPPNASVSNQGVAGSTSYSYKLVYRDAAGGTVTQGSAAINTTTGNATLTGSNFNRITLGGTNFCTSAPVPFIDVYRTASAGTPATNGKIGTITVTDCTAVFTTTNFDDTGLAGDGTTPPAVNTTGGASIAGDLTLNNNKGQHVNTQAANNDFAGTCTLSSGSCTVTFTHAYVNAPVCVATPSTSGTFTTGAALKVNPSTSNVVISSTTGTDSAVVDYICVGSPN